MDWYRKGLGNHPRLRLNRLADWATNVYWMVCVEVEGMGESARHALMTNLRTRGVDSRPYFYPVSDMPMYPKAETPNSHRLSHCGMNLPSYVDLTESDVAFVCAQFMLALEETRA